MQYTGELNDSLNKLLNFLDSTFDINYGGCCYVAYLLSKKLEAYGIKYKLIICDHHMNSNTKKLPIRKGIKNRDLSTIGTGGYTCNHYAIQVGDYLLNMDYAIDSKVAISCITSDDILWMYKTGSWNTTYNKKLNSVIKRFINSFFDGYEKY